MAISFPTTRKMHVTRIAGTNESGEILPNIWVDILRIDEITIKTQDALHFQDSSKNPFTNHYQEVTIRLAWNDENGADESNEDNPLNSNRTVKILKVCNPNETDLQNPSEWVPVAVITKFDLTGGGGNVKTARRFLARALESAREVENRRVVHRDTSIDDNAQAAFDASQHTYRVSTDDYQQNDTDKDTYVEHEVPRKLKGKATHHWLETNGDDLETFWTYKNDFIIDATEDAQLSEVGGDGFNPPYRLDPFQTIINVHFKTLYLIVVASGGNTTSATFRAAPAASSIGISSKAGEDVSGVKLLDSMDVTSGGHLSGFIHCFVYPMGEGLEEAWRSAFGDGDLSGPFGEFSATNNTCVWPGPDPVPDSTNISPVDFFSSTASDKIFLFSIHAGDSLVSTSVSGIMDAFNTGSTSGGGSGFISASVFSTVHGKKVTKISQLIDLNGDGKPRPTEDDTCRVAVTGSDSTFFINVKQTKDKSKIQTDNFGNKFLPYKVTFDHGDFADGVPSQPPPQNKATIT